MHSTSEANTPNIWCFSSRGGCSAQYLRPWPTTAESPVRQLCWRRCRCTKSLKIWRNNRSQSCSFTILYKHVHSLHLVTPSNTNHPQKLVTQVRDEFPWPCVRKQPETGFCGAFTGWEHHQSYKKHLNYDMGFQVVPVSLPAQAWAEWVYFSSLVHTQSESPKWHCLPSRYPPPKGLLKH